MRRKREERPLRLEPEPAASEPAAANEVQPGIDPGLISGPQRQVVPDWLANLAALGWRVLASVALAAVVLYAALLLSIVTASVVIAIIVAAAFTPTVIRLRERGWSKMRAALGVTLGVVGGVVLVLVVIVLAFLPVLVDIIRAVNAGLARASAAIADAGVPSNVTDNVANATAAANEWLLDGAANVAASAADFFTVVILAGFLIFFLLLDGDRAWQWASKSIKPDRSGPFVDSASTAFARIAGYLRDTAIVSTGMGIYVFVVLTILGVPYAGALAVVAFLGGFIPYFGVIVAQAIILVVAYGTTDLTTALILFGLLLLANILRDRYFGPRVVRGERIQVHPAVVLIAVPAGAVFAGLIGMFVAVPVVELARPIARALADAFEPEEDPSLPSIVPGWLDRLAQWSWRVLIVVALGAFALVLVQGAPAIIVPLAMGTIIAATFAPLVDYLVRRGWERTLATMVVVGGAFFGALGVTILTVVTLLQEGRTIAEAAAIGAGDVTAAAGHRLSGLVDVVRETGVALVLVLSGVAGDFALLAALLVLGALLGFYFIRDGGQVGELVRRQLPDRRGEELSNIGARSMSVLSGYMVATGVLSAFSAVTQWITMVVLGLPLALPLAVLSFFGGFIPYIGSFITTGIAFLVTVAVGDPSTSW